MTDKIRVGILFGGRSAEHEVSVKSARSVLEAIDRDKYDVTMIGIDRGGKWLAAGDATGVLQGGKVEGDDLLPAILDYAGRRELTVRNAAGPGSVSSQQLDVVFPILHGPFGEDGTVQGLLELADVPYVGAGVLGSALAMDKLATKEILAGHGIPQVSHRGVHVDDLGAPGSDARAALLDGMLADLGPSVFVKPANMGSSIGVSRATATATLEEALRVAAGYDEWLVVEEAISGREIELAVLGDRVPQVSGPGEIRPGGDFYDYADKYEDGAAQLILDPNLDPETVVTFQELAARAFMAVRCSGMARVDFFLPDDGRGPLVNEVNTIPGFTPISMYPRLWQQAGLTYPALIDRLVDLAVGRHARRRRNTGRSGR